MTRCHRCHGPVTKNVARCVCGSTAFYRGDPPAPFPFVPVALPVVFGGVRASAPIALALMGDSVLRPARRVNRAGRVLGWTQ